MSLRKSPTRTPALLAANRANAQKLTGPRTPGVKPGAVRWAASRTKPECVRKQKDNRNVITH
jgi:hypothetical protein